MDNKFEYCKPINRLVSTKGKHKTFLQVGDVGLMCPHCFHVIKTAILETKTYDIVNIIEDFNTDSNYYGVCPNCKEDAKFIQIDINIADTISILNQKGYYTAFCCEGHIQQDVFIEKMEFITPYIYFYFWADSSILKDYPLPNNWYIMDIDAKNAIFSIHDNIIEKIPNNIENDGELVNWAKTNWDPEITLQEIYNWAVSLPDRADAQKEHYLELVKKYGKNILLENAEKIMLSRATEE